MKVPLWDPIFNSSKPQSLFQFFLRFSNADTSPTISIPHFPTPHQEKPKRTPMNSPYHLQVFCWSVLLIMIIKNLRVFKDACFRRFLCIKFDVEVGSYYGSACSFSSATAGGFATLVAASVVVLVCSCFYHECSRFIGFISFSWTQYRRR